MDRREFLTDLLTAAIWMKLDQRAIAGEDDPLAGTEATFGAPFQFGEERVQGIPLAATIEESNDVTLPDGTHLTHRLRGAFFRDSAGRVRIEYFKHGDAEPLGMNEEVAQVTIIDPTLGQKYRLHVRERVAIRYAREQSSSREVPKRALEISNELRKSRQATSLGVRLIEGFECEGRLVTCTIPATVIANADRPIRIEVEEWIAPELRLLLRHAQRTSLGSKHTRHLLNIRRVEPDAGLFCIPEGYGLIESGVATGLGIEWRVVE